MNTEMDIIKARVSVRKYGNIPLGPEIRSALAGLTAETLPGPFGNRVRFHIVDASEGRENNFKVPGTYGMISGASVYIAGSVIPGPMAMEDFGYRMEDLILNATRLGLGTCWLGGTFRRGEFAERLSLESGEIIPAVTPVGFAAARPGIRETIVRGLVRAGSRRPFHSLFYSAELEALTETTAGAEVTILEAVRLAPSASNKQPWRIICTGKGKEFHLFLDEDPLYNRAIPGIKIQYIDMGIAMRHLDGAAADAGLRGSWQRLPLPPVQTGWKYIASWTAE